MSGVRLVDRAVLGCGLGAALSGTARYCLARVRSRAGRLVGQGGIVAEVGEIARYRTTTALWLMITITVERLAGRLVRLEDEGIL